MNNLSTKSFTQGGTVPVRSHKSCMVYDSKTGRIHHVHHFITLEGGREPTEEAVGEQALSLVAESRTQAADLKVLHVQLDAIKQCVSYSVDLKTLKLIEKKRTSPWRQGDSNP